MSQELNLKDKLGLNVFKPDKQHHVAIKPGRERDPRLLMAISVCPAGLYSLGPEGKVELTRDGCLECGTCRIACGTDVLDWNYRFG
mgnify:FL=1